MRGGLVVALVAVVLSVGGCGAAEPTAAPGELFGEYLRATDVRNDPFAGTGATGEDRLANFASMGTPDQVAYRLLRTYECGERSSSCALTGSITAAATAFAGAGATVLGRFLLVKHGDGKLELVRVYVVQRAGGEARLIDGNGEVHTGLDDFRSGNEVLSHDDTVLTLRDITSVPGEGDLVVVSGHTPSRWQWWLTGVLAVLVAAGAGLVVVRRIRAARDPDPLLTPLEWDSD